jgi:hypothetical protein
MWQSLIRLLFPSYYHRNEYKTVRYAFPIVALTALFAGLAAVTTHDASYISFTTSQSSVREGETFTIEVKANAHVPVNAVDIVVDYPENQMKIQGIDTGTSVITLWTEDPYARGGKVYLRGGVFQKGFLGEHTIARIRAEATATGLAYVNLDSAALVAGDGKGTTVTVEKVSDTQTRIYVTAVDGSLEGAASIDIVTDLDGNGSVDLSDISAFMGAWFSKGKTFDFNGDGRMTFKDFSILLADSFFK